ncbi:MAG: hypothetical protein P4K98_02015 [Bryobacteraceae bacterium]|nr:hypothetical protein [Bryobacteraceae bacterium]
MKQSIATLAAALLVLAALPAAAQKKYNGPRPPKPDIPFLVHANQLIPIETGDAREAQGKNETNYSVAGAASPIRTPIPEPVFLFQSDKINPERLSLFRMEVKGGQRTLALPSDPRKKRDNARPLFILVSPLENRLFKVEVNEPLDNGEYCLSPEGTNTVFCFSEF